MYMVYMAGRPPRQKAKNDARQQLWWKWLKTEVSVAARESLLILSLSLFIATSVAVFAVTSLISPRKILFLLSKNTFIGSKYPTKRSFL